MKLLLISEGNNELSGALQALVTRLLGIECEIDAKTIRDREFSDVPGKGLFKRSLRCLRYAERNHYDCVVIVVDQDEDRYKPRRLDLNKAQESDLFPKIKRAFGVAIQAFDAWMLSDEKSLSNVLGYLVQRQPDPESIAVPKVHFERLRASSSRVDGRSILFRELAEKLDLGILIGRCPLGFGPFAERVRRLKIGHVK